MDYQETLGALAWIAVPTIADWCAVDMLEHGTLRRLAAAHMDPAKRALVTELEERVVDPHSTPRRVIATGKAELYEHITDDMISARGNTPDVVEKIQRLGLRSFLIVPLRRGDEVVGTITMATAESGRTFDATDLALATTLADRASISIAHAHLFRQAERALHVSASERDRLVQLIQAMPISIGVLRGSGDVREMRLEVANAAFAQLYGGRDMIGHTLAELDPHGTRTLEISRVMTTGEKSVQHEFPIQFDWLGTGTETVRFFNVTRAALRDADGAIDSLVTMSLDVTEQVTSRKRLEEAREQAELGNRAKDEFLAMLGHELRNPLAPILTALELMELRAPEALQRERTVIQRQVRHVVRLVDDLLDISRITRGGVELHREAVDLADTIAKAVEQASPLLEEKRHQLVTDIARGVFVDGDPVRLAQIVANLVTNAAKYSERGATITITLARDEKLARLRVRDTGVGIAADILPHVFETFYQVRQTIDRTRGGLGLGLSIVRSLVSAHGGEVHATSEGLGHGSEFVVELPAIEAPVVPRATGTPVAGTHALRPEKILVVDDNQDALALLADALIERGFPTFTAHDAPSALAIAERERPQIALLDIGLPVMDGYELGRRLRATRGLDRLQLVAVTGYGQATDRERSLAAGFDAHLVKPIAIEAVLATIERLILEARAALLPSKP